MATPYSPLRPRGDTFTALDRAEDRFGEEQDVARGLVRTLTSMTASGLADEALRREAAGQAGWEDRRDAALATQREAAAYAPRISSLRDAAGLGDVVDFIQGAAPGAAASTLPSLGAALLTRGRWRPAAFVGAAVPSYLQSRGEIAAEQYIDPVLSQASVEERDRAATYGGAAMAALDTVLPGSLANSALRKPARDFLSQTGRAAVTEGLTETAQTGIQQFAHNTIDPTRGYDVWEMLDAGVAGAVGGAGLAGAMRAPSYAINALSSRAQPAQNDAAPIDLNPPSDPMEGAPPGTSPLPTPDDGSGGVGDLFDTLNERFGPGIREQAQRTKDYVSDTIDRMTEAAKTAQSPDEFLRQVFGNSAEEAAADLRPDTEDPIVLNAADPAAALQQRSAERQQRAARFAEELLNDPATPDAVKERVASFGGDFSNPEAQAYVARNLVAQRAGEKLATAVMDLIDLSKNFGTDMATKARDMLDEGMTAAADRIVKKNLQDTTPAEQAAFNKLIFDSLTDEAKANPTVRQHLPEIANAMLAFAARTGELTKDDLKTLSRIKDGLAIFRDPDALAAQLTEYAGLPRPEDSFLSRIKRITNAQQDIRRPNSFLYYSLTEKAKDTLSSAELNGLARLVDDFSIIDADKEQGDKVLAGLIAAFGSKESAQAVLDYYRQQNRADLRFDLNETLQEDGSNPMKEVDAPKASYHFADAKSMRPFRAFVGHMTSEGGMRRRLRESTIAGVALRRSLPSGARVRPVKMSQYVADTGRDPEVEVRRIANDIKDRIAQHEARKDEDRTKQINELRGELTLLRRAYKDGGAQAALDLYEVLEVSGQEQSDTIATDEDIAKMATLANAKDAKETRVTFQREDGSKFTLSAESMWKTMGDKEGSGKGENAQVRAKRLFADAVASVLARPEVAKVVTPMENILIDRKLGVRAKRKDNPKYRKMVADALKAAEDSLKQLEATLDAVVEEYLDAADNEAKSEEYGSRREEIEGIIEKNIAQLSERLDAAREGKGPLAGNKPAQAVARQKLRMYREAQNQIDAIKFDEEFDERDDNRSGIPGADKTGPLGPNALPRTRMNEELGNVGPRFAEEDTGLGVGVEKRGPKSEPSAQKKEEPKTISEAAINALYDIAVKGNYSRLDTPEKVLRYAAMAREMMDRLAQIPRGDRSDRQQELLSKLRADFKQDGNAAFDWDKLFDGMKPTDEQRAMLKNIVAKKRVVLPNISPYTAKDQAKSDRANKFIGRGAPGSSTAAYAEAWGDRANTGVYDSDDVVFISVNGNRPGALSPPWAEIKKAMSAGATLITDTPADRARSFNTGERAVAEFLSKNGYVEESPGTWVRDSVVRKKSFVGAKADPQGAAEAEGLLGVGTPADVVWRELGWFRGPDGKLRKEVRSPVLRRRVRDLATAIANGTAKPTTIGALLEGIDEFKPYLDKLGSVPVRPDDPMVELIGAVGAYIPDDEGTFSAGIGFSRLNAEVAARMEAIPDGKGPEVLRDITHRLTPKDDELPFATTGFATTRDVLAELERMYPLPDINERVAKLLTGTILHELQHAFQHVEGFENGGNATTAVIAKYGDVDEYLAAVRDGDERTVERITEQAFARLRAEVGPDGDMEAAAHKLYESIIGEVEANDVAARMNLSDEEARMVAPALADAKREFVRSLMLAEALSAVRGMRSASSRIGGRPGRPGKDWGDKEAVKAEILRLRGKDVKVRVEKLVRDLGGSGQYTYNPKTGERLIEVAINARSPLGTARHEAMHDLFRFLSENEATRSIARDLRDATSAPHVIRRLRELLKDHKAALEQLSDPEERAAYAYQFWAEGLLQIGPTGTGIFNTIRQFIKDLFGIVTASQRGEDLMRAFHDGKFADPSIVQEVLQDINDRSGDRLSNKMNRAAPALTRALNAIFSAAPNRLRRFENDYLNQLADKFQPESGTGFIQNKFQQEGVWMNRLAGILRGTTAVERREAIDQLQSMNPTSKLAKELLKFNEDIYEYMRDAGVQSWDSDTKKFVPLRKVQGYFARSWDPDAIARNRTEFEALLRTEGGVSAANAAALTENLIRGSEQRPKPKESPVDLGFMPYAPHTSERVLTFIKPSNADKFAKFQRKDLADIMTSYIRGATHRAEYARAFGNNGEKIVELVSKSGIRNPEELNEISNAVQAMEGSLDPGNWSVQTKEAMSALMTLQNVTLLPLALVSQMIDPIVLAARTGDLKDAGTAYVTALKRLKNTITKSKDKVPGEELAEILGVVSEDSTLQALSMAYGATRMSKRMENINRVFFKYNGMQGWNNSMRIAATAAGEKYLLAHKNDARALAELGLEPKDIKSVNGKLDVSNPKVQQAMFQFVDQAVLRPSAANRPVWMSDPRFLLVAHLKQFTFAMHNVVLKRANRELQNDNPKPWGILMLAMPVILAADMAKFALTGTTPSSWGFKDYLVHAVERAGLLGLGDFGVQATRGVGMGKMPGEELLGPTFENLMEILRWISGDPRTSLGDVIDRTVPGSRFI